MPSPFPGMDPYLEAHWGDVHSRLVLYSCDALRDRLPGSLYARVEERVVLECYDEQLPQRVPDVRIVEFPGARSGDGAVAVLEADAPIIVSALDEQLTETFIEIRDAARGHQVVTVIEFLSPANKRRGEDRDQYLAKAAALRRGYVSLVEVDLLRKGVRGLPIPESLLERVSAAQYRVVVRRGQSPQRFEVYPISIRERLPRVAIPLRAADADVTLNLQQVLDQTYDFGNYRLTTDYSQPPTPPLDGDDAAWCGELLCGRSGVPA